MIYSLHLEIFTYNTYNLAHLIANSDKLVTSCISEISEIINDFFSRLCYKPSMYSGSTTS